MKITTIEQARLKAFRKLDREESSIRLLVPMTANAHETIEKRLLEIADQKARLNIGGTCED